MKMKIRKAVSVILVLMSILTSCTKISVDSEGGETKTPDINTEQTTAGEATDDTTAPSAPDNKKDPSSTVTSKASFAGVGDNIIYFGTFRDAEACAYQGGRKYNFSPIYQNVKDIISSADIAFVNQETVCSQSYEPESYPQFNSPVDLTYDVVDAGFDIINLANNHMLDKGAQGIYDSYHNWLDRGITVIGCYEESDSKYITYYEKNDIVIAFVSYTYGTNLNEDPANKGLYAPYLKQSDIEGDITEAKENSDFVIVSVHWGEEGMMTPNEEQKSFASRMAKSGADVILGHHPHVLQPIEWLDNGDGGKCLCCYSLGNFVHEQAYDYNVPGGIITFDIVKNGGITTAENVEFIPTVCHYPGNFYGNTVYLFKDYNEQLANAHAVRTYYNNPISYDRLEGYITDTIPAEFLPDYMK